MKKIMIVLLFLVTQAAWAEDERLKPFVLASVTKASMDDVLSESKQKLTLAGFEILADYEPFGTHHVLVATHPKLMEIAKSTERGGYGAVQRIGISAHGDEVEVSYVNPVYLQHAYRLDGDMQVIADILSGALGAMKTFGSKKGMKVKKLKKYHYMMSMPYFDDPYEYDAYDSYELAVKDVAERLDATDDGLSLIYRLDIPGKEQTIFGVGMKKSNEDEEDIDEQFQLGVVDFERPSKVAYVPYELMVNGNVAEALHMKFRMAMHFPDLPMMGKHGFTKLMSSPGAIDDAFEKMLESHR